MKPGSLVECIQTCMGLTNSLKQVGQPIDKGTILTVRKLTHTTIQGLPIVLFEEIQNPPAPSGREYGYPIHKFRELLPPTVISIEEILEKELV